MRIKIHNLVFDEADPLCRCILTALQGQLYAFIQAVDIGLKGDLRIPKQYWGCTVTMNLDSPLLVF